MKDLQYKDSPFYIRKKIEMGVVAERVANKYIRNFIILVMVVYMYGAICLKFVSGADSFAFGVSYTIWGDQDAFEKHMNGFDPYYLGIIVFGFFSIYFSFGNIENAKTLQMVTTILRFVVTTLMCAGSLYYIGEKGPQTAPVFDFKDQLKYLAKVFGNTTFVFIYHHSVSGIIYPIRPQKDIQSMFLWSNIIGSIFLVAEALLAWVAFSGLDNNCIVPKGETAEFPCAVAELYNENFLKLPGIGQICNFYPMLNIAAVPILNITLRNNLLDVIPIKPFIKRKGRCLCLLDDHKNSIKGLWSCILSIPVLCVVFVYRDVQALVTYTGGFCGAFILLIFPAMLAQYGRKLNIEERLGSKNPNSSPFKHPCWIYLVYVWAAICLTSVIIKIATGGGGE